MNLRQAAEFFLPVAQVFGHGFFRTWFYPFRKTGQFFLQLGDTRLSNEKAKMSAPQTISEELLNAARKAGAEAADAIVIDGSSVSVEVRSGALEHAERSEATDLGLRVFLGKQQAIVSSSDSRPDTLTAMAERAVAMAREAPEDPFTGLAAPDQLVANCNIDALELFDPAPEPGAEDDR